MEPAFSLSRTFTHAQHRECVILGIRQNPRDGRIAWIALYSIGLLLFFWVKELRIFSRLIVALPLLFYQLFFKVDFRVMFHKERYESSTICYDFHPQSICVSFSNRWEADISLAYTDVFKIIETADQIHLLNSKDVLIALPKEDFSASELKDFRTFLTEKTSKQIKAIE